MFIETKTRSVVKAFSYRVFGTLVTVLVTFLFFNRLDLAIAAGLTDSLVKIYVFYMHERLWNKVSFGKDRIEPFTLWFTGLPLSGKTTIADAVHEKLKHSGILLERLDSKDVRELFPEVGYTKEDRFQHIKRVGHLIHTLQNYSISVIASFVSPSHITRECVKSQCRNFIEIYVKTSLEECQKRDYKGVYAKAISGKIENFTGISDEYEVPVNPAIILDTEILGIEESAKVVLDYLYTHCIKKRHKGY